MSNDKTLSKAYMKGKELKNRAKSYLPLNKYEEGMFDRFPVQAVPQKFLNEMADSWNLGVPSERNFPFDTPGVTTEDPTQIFIRNEFPYVPKLTLGNIRYLPAYDTEGDVIAHEIGHARDLLEKGTSSEPSAQAFERSITERIPTDIGVSLAKSRARRQLFNLRNSRNFYRPTEGTFAGFFPSKKTGGIPQREVYY